MSFRPLTAPIDYIVLAGRRSPGLATIEGASTPREFDERRAFGMGFSLLRFRGVKLARFKVLLRLITVDHWDDWHVWKEVVARPEIAADPRRPTRPRAPPMEIEHPILADMGIGSVVVENVAQPIQTADGEWTIEIAMIEYREPVRQLEQPSGTVDKPEIDPVEAEIARNDAIIAALSNPRGRSSR
jgi:hypothetical protein